MVKKESRLVIKTAKLTNKLAKLGAKLDEYNIPLHIEFGNKTYLKEKRNDN